MALRAEGRLAEEWVAVVEQECAAVVRDFGSVHLDLTAVTYVDSRGAAALRNMVRNHVTLSNCPPLIRELIGEDGLP